MSHGHSHASTAGAFRDAAQYEQHAARRAARLYHRVARDVVALGLPEGARVLDIGTGPGTVPRLIAAERPDLAIDAVDVAPEMIAQAGTHDSLGVTFSVADVVDLPWPDATFDLVISTLSQHHWADREAGMREVRRVLRPGGVAWIYDLRSALAHVGPAAGEVTPVQRVGRLHRTWLPARVGRLALGN